MDNTTVFLTLLIEIQRLVIDVECYLELAWSE